MRSNFVTNTMDLDRSILSSDEYYVTALKIFDDCGAERTGTLSVVALRDKFEPFVKTNKTEFSYLISLLDPYEENPEIDVSMLARTLHKYSMSQKSKLDLDESFNKSGVSHESDSGISTDAGFQLVEELQCEVRVKAHLAQQLRAQLDSNERQHEEAHAALTAERDSLRAHLNMLREENMSLMEARRDYEEACEHLCGAERALHDTRRDLEAAKRRNKVMLEQIATLENEKLTLQELLSESKKECHRINEMYASRQSALLEHNEALRTEHADLSARMQDQDEFVQQIIKEKALLEMELKDVLNKSNHTQLRMNRSIEISYTDEQILTALDSLNQDSQFSSDNRILEEESFINALKEDQGRATNMSLFDEIRYSFCNLSQHNNTESNNFGTNYDLTLATTGTQTDIMTPYDDSDKVQIIAIKTSTQTEEKEFLNNNAQSKCFECEKISQYTDQLERDMNKSYQTVTAMQVELDRYERNLNIVEKFVKEGTERNSMLQDIIRSLEMKIGFLEVACGKQRDRIESLTPDCCASSQTEWDQTSVATQADVPCVECEEQKVVVPQRSLRKFFWGSIKCLFQLFAAGCFICALAALYGMPTRSYTACARKLVPWRWMDAQDIMDLLLRIEYVADVPM